MRRKLPGESWKDWRRRNEPELHLIGFVALWVFIGLVAWAVG